LFWSLCYLVLRRLLQLAALRFRSDESKELEIVLLRHELAVLRRQLAPPELSPPDRVFLAAASLWGAQIRSCLQFRHLSRRAEFVHLTGS
jgi:hypothetical protein